MGTSAAEPSRSVIADEAIKQFTEESGTRVSPEVRTFILNKVLIQDDQFQSLVQTESLDPQMTTRILVDALERANQSAGSEREILMDHVGDEREGPFYAVIHDKWHCPFPFWFC
jgi:hypothetical protein